MLLQLVKLLLKWSSVQWLLKWSSVLIIVGSIAGSYYKIIIPGDSINISIECVVSLAYLILHACFIKALFKTNLNYKQLIKCVYVSYILGYLALTQILVLITGIYLFTVVSLQVLYLTPLVTYLVCRETAVLWPIIFSLYSVIWYR